MDSRIFVIGRDPVPEYIRLEAGESLRWTFVFCPSVAGGGCRPVRPSEPETGERLLGTHSPDSADSADRVRVEIDLCGPGAEVDIAGLYLCRGEEKLDLDVLVRHTSGGCVSRQNFKGIVGGKAKASFEGLIYVAKDAQKTRAYQENHTILLDDTARVESRPQLEIYADDVECSHGATTGFLNEEELFYMRSRGIPEAEARRLQMISFLAPVLERLPEDLKNDIISEC